MLSIDALALFESISVGNTTLLIDVRQPEELIYGTIDNSVNFPLSDIPTRLEELESLIKNEAKESIVIFCRVGGRSEQVINFLEQRGSKQLTNLLGGTQKYSEFDSRIRKY